MAILLPLLAVTAGGLYTYKAIRRARLAEESAVRQETYIPTEAFMLVNLRKDDASTQAVYFVNETTDLAFSKLLRYRPSGQKTVTFAEDARATRLRAVLTYRGSVAKGGLPKSLTVTAIEFLRSAHSRGEDLGLGSISLATIPTGTKIEALTFAATIDNLALFPQSIDLVSTNNAKLAAALTVKGNTPEKQALGLLDVPLAVASTDLATLSSIPSSTALLLQEMSK